MYPTPPIQDRLLASFCDRPLTSALHATIQLGLPAVPNRTLRRLVQSGHLTSVAMDNSGAGRTPGYLPTEAGIARVARFRSIAIATLLQANGLYHCRIDWLYAMSATVYEARSFHAYVSGLASTQGWTLHRDEVEVVRDLIYKKDEQCTLHFDGAGTIMRSDGRRFTYGLIVDSLLDPTNVRARDNHTKDLIDQYAMAYAYQGPHYRGGELDFPALIILAANENHYCAYEKMVSTAFAGHIAGVPVYIVALADLSTHYASVPLESADVAEDTQYRKRPIQPATPTRWARLSDGQMVGLFEGIPGVATPLPEGLWRRYSGDYQYHGRPLLSPPPSQSRHPRNSLQATVGVLQNMSLLHRRTVEILASHPYLSTELLAKELGLKRQNYEVARRVLRELGQWDLITSTAYKEREFSKAVQSLIQAVLPLKRDIHQEHHELTDAGYAHLALIAGYGRAVKAYRQARGVDYGPKHKLRTLGHTNMENLIEMAFKEACQNHGLDLEWTTEPEGRRYYEGSRHDQSESRLHAYLPDGQGRIRKDGSLYHIATEVELQRKSAHAFRGKPQVHLAARSTNFEGDAPSQKRLVLFIVPYSQRKLYVDVLREVLHETLGSKRIPVEFILTYLTSWYRVVSDPRKQKATCEQQVDQKIWIRIDPNDEVGAPLPAPQYLPMFEPDPAPPEQQIRLSGQATYLAAVVPVNDVVNHGTDPHGEG